MSSEDSKKRLLVRIADLKDEVMTDIFRSIEQSSEDKQYETKRRLDKIKNKFAEIMESEGVSVNQEYLDTQLNVLESQIKRTLKGPNEDLCAMVSKRLSMYVDILSAEKDKDEIEAQTTHQKGNIQYELEENKGKRKKDVSLRIIPSIEEYIDDVFSNTRRRLDSFGITISGQQLDYLRSSISSQLKNKSVTEIEDFFIDEDNQLFRRVSAKLEEFFNTVEQMRVQDEQGENKSPNALLFEHFEIDHELAIKRLAEQGQQKSIYKKIEGLPDDVIK